MKDQKVAPLDDAVPTQAAPTKTDLPGSDPSPGLRAGFAARVQAARRAENAQETGPGSPDGDAATTAVTGAAPPSTDDRTGITRLGDPVAVRPCAGCGRPVPQPAHGAPTGRQCLDGAECERAAREARERGLDSTGLTGQVAWAWEMVDRLEGAAHRLAGALNSELSVAGVERRVAAARADAAGDIAIARRERDASRRREEAAWREAASSRTRAEAAERERDRVAAREGELLASLENARAELVTLHRRLSEAETLVEGQRVEADAAQRSAEDLRSAVRDAEAKRGQAVADRDQNQARAREYDRHNRQLSRTVEELRAALKTVTAERDAARAEADRARRRVDALSTVAEGRRDGGERPAVDREPPTGLHTLPANGLPPDTRPLNGHRLPHAG
ncbi:hypothetical protein D0T12_33325 [Actinomadura spongiicola]|uniref:Chromosome segregation ATPase n=1 Tax=Actinomadura spongiicola TaxID=2303421 RepID=A0A372G783_9ACTN|nr:hypothetical protein [Actinomadura spongiicola]RFS81254.1 hypothetical protein D0T12_33325 [Actinomadura spongiicola]